MVNAVLTVVMYGVTTVGGTVAVVGVILDVVVTVAIILEFRLSIIFDKKKTYKIYASNNHVENLLKFNRS